MSFEGFAKLDPLFGSTLLAVPIAALILVHEVFNVSWEDRDLSQHTENGALPLRE